MKPKIILLLVVFLFGLATAAIALVSWIIYPQWRDTPQTLLPLILSAAGGLLIAIREGIELWKSVEELRIKRKEGKRTYLSGEPQRPTRSKLPAATTEIIPATGDLPPGSRLPFLSNPLFTGRDEDLLALKRMLIDDQENFGPVIICGIGGSGKTQLAVEFCRRYGRFFSGVHWLQCAQPEQIPAEITTCGLQMDIQPWPDREVEQIEVTYQAWNETPNRLIVLDNLEKTDVLHTLMARLEKQHLLVTARQMDWRHELGYRVYQLSMLPRSSSRELLRRLASELKQVPDEEIDRLADRLGNLPLALDLAGRYLSKRDHLTPEEFLRELDSVGGAILHPSQRREGRNTPTEHTESLESTFSLSWKILSIDTPVDILARKLFLMVGFCAPVVSIPHKLLQKAAQLEENQEPYFFDSLLRLYDLGLLRKNPDGPSIHPLLSNFSRIIISPVEKTELLSGFAAALAELTDSDQIGGVPSNFHPYRPHIEKAVEEIEEAQLEHAGEIWHNLAFHLELLADYSRARECFKRSLAIDEKFYPPDHPKIAVRLNNLGLMHLALKELEDARVCFEKALAINEKALGPENGNVATNINNIAAALQDMGKFEEAIPYLEKARAINEKVFGPENTSVAYNLNNLGYSLRYLGKYQEAKEVGERVFAMDEKNLGLDHPLISRDYLNLGACCQELGQLNEAKHYFEKALAVAEKNFGYEHPRVAQSLNMLGHILQEMGFHQEARASFERALTVSEKALGPNHPSVARDLVGCAQILRESGDLQEALDKTKRALLIDENTYPPGHHCIARDWNTLALILRDMGQLKEAKAACEKAIAMDEANFGKEHPFVARDITTLGSINFLLGENEHAKGCFERALASHQKYQPENRSKIERVKAHLEQLKV